MNYVTLKIDWKFIDSTLLRIFKECGCYHNIVVNYGHSFLEKKQSLIECYNDKFQDMLNGYGAIYDEITLGNGKPPLYLRIEYKDKKRCIDRCLKLSYSVNKIGKSYEIDIDDAIHFFYILISFKIMHFNYDIGLSKDLNKIFNIIFHVVSKLKIVVNEPL